MSEVYKQNQKKLVKTYKYTPKSSYFCIIEKNPTQPIGEHPKGWSPELQQKLDKRREK